MKPKVQALGGPVARERRDGEVDKLEKQFATQLDRLRDKLNKEQRDLEQAKAEQSARKTQQYIGIGETVLGWVLGRSSTRGLSSAANKWRQASRAGEEVVASEQDVAELQKDITELEQQLKEQTDQITMKWANLMDDLTSEELSPRRTDIDVQMVALAWLPSWQIRYNDGAMARTATVAAYQLPAVG